MFNETELDMMITDFDSFMMEEADRIRTEQEDIPEWIRTLSDKTLCTFINERAMVARPTTFERIDEFKQQPGNANMSSKELYDYYIRLMRDEARYRGHTLKYAIKLERFDALYIQNQLYLVLDASANQQPFRRRWVKDEIIFMPAETGALDIRYEFFGVGGSNGFCVLSHDAVDEIRKNNEGR